MTNFEAAFSLHRQNRLDEAASAYNQILNVDPAHFPAAYHFSVLRASQGRFDDALRLADQSIDASPNVWHGHAQKGALLLATGRFEAGLAALEHAVELDAGQPHVLNNLGAALRAVGRTDEARRHLERAVELAPDYVDALNNLSGVLVALEKHDESASVLQRIAMLQPQSAQLRDQLGIAYWKAGRPDDAKASFRDAIALDARHADAWSHLGNVLMEEGDIVQARASFLRAIEYAPDRPELYRFLLQTDRSAIEQHHVEHLLALSHTQLSSAARIDVHFALAVAFDARNDTARSFEHLHAGNACMRALQHYDEGAVLQALERQKTLYHARCAAKDSTHGDRDETPVFIFGMPRSGTTLVEQILAAHPAVSAAGEFSFFGNFLDGGDMGDAGRRYAGALRDRGGPAALRITDKTPANFQFSGLIHLALPNAKLIHVRRDPLDTCFSCYSQTFLGRGLAWAYDLRELGRYYRAYQRLMEYWREVLPQDVMLEIDYEDVIADFKTQARRIVAHCGLPWDDACLEFYKAERSVKTASATQVRKPIYGSSVGRWRAYAQFLQPLRDALGEPTRL